MATRRRYAWSLLALVSPVVAFAACEQIAGIEDMAVYKPVDTDAGQDVQQDVQEDIQQETGPVVCTLGEQTPPPSTAMRFANLVPTADAVDFCVKASSGASYDAPPVMQGYGSQCPALAYGQVLVPVAFEAGTYDVKVVASGSKDCGGAALSEAKGVTVAAGRATTVVRLGGAGGVAEKLVAHLEVSFGKDQSTRLMHAVSTDEVVFFGITTGEQVPTTIAAPFTEGVAPGGVPAANPSVVGIGSINDAGYLGTMGVQFNIGATRSGKKDALFVATPSGGNLFTVYAVGLPGSFEYPVQGLLCQDDRYVGTGVAGVQQNWLTQCGRTKLKELSIDTINTGLYGDFAPFENERRDKIIEELAKLPSDFLCVQEMTREADRAALVEAAAQAGTYLHSYNPQFNLDTPYTDGKDQSGAVPPPAGPACGAIPAKLDAAIQCMVDKCAEEIGNPDSPIGEIGGDCFSKKCPAQFLVLLSGEQETRCLSCLIVNVLSSETMNDTRDLCLNDGRPQYAFRGASTEVMLSKYPLSNMESYVFPSTSYRRAILSAKAEVAPDEFIDVYCTQLSYPQGPTFPYSGQYGADTTVDGIAEPLKGWNAEQYLQAQRGVAWIQSRVASGALAVIAGDLSSGDSDSADLSELNPASVRLFRSSFEEAIPAGYDPKCTFCPYPENPYGGEDGLWLAHVFTTGRDVGVLSLERTLMEKSVSLPESPFEGTLSDNFGLRSKIIYGLTW
jgi:hypothetical protein